MSYRDAFRPCSRVSSDEKQNVTLQVSKKSGKRSNGKFYKRMSNYIKTFSAQLLTLANLAVFGVVLQVLM